MYVRTFSIDTKRTLCSIESSYDDLLINMCIATVHVCACACVFVCLFV